MQAIQWVISTCMAISWLFYDIYLDMSGWWEPFNLLAGPFLWVSDRFIDLAANFTSFMAWVDYATDWIAKILSWDTIWSLIKPYFQWGIDAWEWVKSAWSIVWGEIEEWWSYTKTTVLGWIDIATEGFNEWIPKLDYFFTERLPLLFDVAYAWEWWGDRRVEVNDLINARLREWFPWYDALAQSMEGILTFFTDPAKAVYELFDYVIDRFWEDS